MLLIPGDALFSRYGSFKFANVLSVGVLAFDPTVHIRYWSNRSLITYHCAHISSQSVETSSGNNLPKNCNREDKIESILL